jgi:hypothetical protein
VTQHGLHHLPRASLERMARARGIAGTSRLTREQLIDVLGGGGGLRLQPFVVVPPAVADQVRAAATAEQPVGEAASGEADVAEPEPDDAEPVPVMEPGAAPPTSEPAAPAVAATPAARPARTRAGGLLLPALVGAAAAGVLAYLLDPFGRR